MVSVPAAHPGLLAAICPDRSPGALKTSLLELRNGSGCVIFTRDSGSGSVSIDGEGRPVIRYWPDKTTQTHLFDVRRGGNSGAGRVATCPVHVLWLHILNNMALLADAWFMLEVTSCCMRCSNERHPQHQTQPSNQPT
jgi:hypothetical protein